MAGLSDTLEKIKNREPSWKEQPTQPSLTSSNSDRAVHKKKPPVFVRIRVVTLVISFVHFGCGKTAVTDGEKKNQASWRPLRTQPGKGRGQGGPSSLMQHPVVSSTWLSGSG